MSVPRRWQREALGCSTKQASSNHRDLLQHFVPMGAPGEGGVPAIQADLPRSGRKPRIDAAEIVRGEMISGLVALGVQLAETNDERGQAQRRICAFSGSGNASAGPIGRSKTKRSRLRPRIAMGPDSRVTRLIFSLKVTCILH